MSLGRSAKKTGGKQKGRSKDNMHRARRDATDGLAAAEAAVAAAAGARAKAAAAATARVRSAELKATQAAIRERKAMQELAERNC